MTSVPFDWPAQSDGLGRGWLFEAVWNLVDATTLVGITSDGFTSGQNFLSGITALVMLLSFWLQLITGLVRSHPPALSHKDEQSK